MGSVRPVEARDLRRLAEIHLAVFGAYPSTEEQVMTAYTEKATHIVGPSAFSAHASPSLVFEDAGAVTGFVLVGCQPVVFAGERRWAASTSHLAVLPEARSSLAAVHLLREVTKGPQDLVYVDQSNAGGRAALRAAGFEQFPGYSLRWKKVLRRGALRGRQIASRTTKLSATRVVELANQAETWAPERLRNAFVADLPDKAKRVTTAPLTPEHVWEVASQVVSGFDLHSVFDDPEHLTQNWETLSKRRPNSVIKTKAVVTDRGATVGFFILEKDRVGNGNVIQMAALPRHRQAVLLTIFHEAMTAGALVVHGDLELDMLYDVHDVGGDVECHESTTSVYSDDPKVLETFLQGRALLSLIEGEFLLSPTEMVAQ